MGDGSSANITFFAWLFEKYGKLRGSQNEFWIIHPYSDPFASIARRLFLLMDGGHGTKMSRNCLYNCRQDHYSSNLCYRGSRITWDVVYTAWAQDAKRLEHFLSPIFKNFRKENIILNPFAKMRISLVLEVFSKQSICGMFYSLL